MEFFKEIRSTLLIMAGFYIVVGLIMVIAPTIVNNAICYLVGGLCLIMGGLAIYIYLGSEIYGPLAVATLIVAITLIVTGIFIITMPEVLLSLIPIAMGVILIVNAFSKMQSAVTLQKYKYDKWWTVLVGALIVFTLGILLLICPFESITLFTRILGLFLAVDGVSSFVTALSYNKIEKAIKW